MDDAMKIVNSLMKIEERSTILRHGEEVVFEGINLAEVHCIDWIGMTSDANVTKVADKMSMTRGGISKITQKLLNKGLIESYQRPNNNKEIYYRLTQTGQHIYNVHKKCHSKAKQEKLALLSAYSEQEQTVILRFLNNVNQLLDSKMFEKISPGE